MWAEEPFEIYRIVGQKWKTVKNIVEEITVGFSLLKSNEAVSEQIIYNTKKRDYADPKDSGKGCSYM